MGKFFHCEMLHIVFVGIGPLCVQGESPVTSLVGVGVALSWSTSASHPPLALSRAPPRDGRPHMRRGSLEGVFDDRGNVHHDMFEGLYVFYSKIVMKAHSRGNFGSGFLTQLCTLLASERKETQGQ